MKILKYLAAAALTLLAVGCNKEQVTEVSDGQMVDVTFTAALPGEMATKALGDGQTAKNLYVSVYENDADKTHLRDLDKTATFTDLKTQVKFSLVKGKTYNFVFWAQAEGAPYDVTDLKNIKVKNYTTDANDEKRDAFYATRKELKVNGALTETIKLYRPFAQVNFATADYAEAQKAGFSPAVSSFTASGAATTFDTFASEGKDEVTVALTETNVPADILKTLDGKTYTRLAMNYLIPVGKQGESHNIDVAATFKANNGEAVTVSAPNAPVQNNYRTNILGNLLTSQVIFNVEIVPIFNEPDNDIDLVNIKNAESLKALVATGGSAELVDDIEIDYPLVLSGNTDVVIDLNGHSIVNKTQVNGNFTVVFNVTGNSHLTINGEGEVKALEETSDVDGYRMAVWAYDDAVVDINGGYFYNKQLNSGTSNLIYVMDRAVVNVAGGKFETAMLDAQGTSLLLNIFDADRATAKINITGGQFVNFDPADCVSEGAHTNFLAAGYKSVKKGDSYVVMPENQSIVATAAELDEAIAAVAEGVKSEIILNAGTYDNVIDITDKGKVITFKPANGAEVVLAGVNVQSNNTKTDCVFENITFDNSLQSTGWYVGTGPNIYPCVGVWGGKLAFKNCKFIVDGNTGKETGVMTWWTTEECGATLTFDGCSFEGKNNHAEARAMQIYGHVNLDVQNCRLATAKRYAIKYVGNEGYVATIKNCNVSNCKYTVELGSGEYPGSKYVVNFEGNTLAEGIADYKIANDEGATVNGGVAL